MKVLFFPSTIPKSLKFKEEKKSHDVPIFSKNKEETKETHFPLSKVSEPLKKFGSPSTKMYLKAIVPEKIPMPENTEKSQPKEPEADIKKNDSHPTNSNIPLQEIPEFPQQLETQPSLEKPLITKDLNHSNQQISHIIENNASLADFKSINSNENPQINVNVNVMNAKVLEEQTSSNNLSNGNESTNFNTMNASLILSRMEPKPLDFSLIEPSTTVNQILQNHQDNPFLTNNQNITTNVPSQLQYMFSNGANPFNGNNSTSIPNFTNNTAMFPQNQNMNPWSTNVQTQDLSFQTRSQLPMFFVNPPTANNQPNPPFFNPQYSQIMHNQPNEYQYPNHQTNNFAPPQNQNNSFLESPNNMEPNGNLNDISFGNGQEIQMQNTANNTNIFDHRMLQNNQNNQPQFHGNFGQNNNQNMFPNTTNNNQMMEGFPSNLYCQNNNQIENARSMFANKPNDNNNNQNLQQPIPLSNLFAPQNNNAQNQRNITDTTQERMMINKKNDNMKLRANNRNF